MTQIPETREFQLNSNLKFIIYGKLSNQKHPKNAAIYYNEGSLKIRIEAPFFKTEKMIHGIKNEQHSRPERDVWIIHPHKNIVKNFWGKVIEEKPQQGFFESYIEMKKINKKEYAKIMISDGAIYFEFQYLDLDTGQFINQADWGGRF